MDQFLNNVPTADAGCHCWDWHVWVEEQDDASGGLRVHDVLSASYVETIQKTHDIPGIAPGIPRVPPCHTGRVPKAPASNERMLVVSGRTYDDLRNNEGLNYVPATPQVQRELFRLAFLVYEGMLGGDDGRTRAALARAAFPS